MLNEEVLHYIEAHWEEGYQLLLTLAQIPAPSHHEEKRVEFCKNWLEAMGAKGVYVDEALNVVYPYQCEEGKPLVVFMAHMDVVFPDTTPLPLTEKDGKICCPGVGDDTANLVALLLTARYVTQKHLDVRDCGVLFVCNSCEEGMGNLKGSKKICETYGDRIKEFYSFDGTMGWLVNRAVGSARYRVTVKTRGGHSYGCFGRENAIAELASIIHDIYQIRVPEEGKTTYNVGTIQGGTSVNTIAQEVQMLCEYRSDRKDGLEYMEKKFHEIFESHKKEYVEVDVELVGLRPCENLNEEQESRRQEMIRIAQDISEKLTGIRPDGIPGSTDCNIPLSLGIPAVCYGVVAGEGAHTREEYVVKASLKTGYQVAFASVLRYFEGV